MHDRCRSVASPEHKFWGVDLSLDFKGTAEGDLREPKLGIDSDRTSWRLSHHSLRGQLPKPSRVNLFVQRVKRQHFIFSLFKRLFLFWALHNNDISA